VSCGGLWRPVASCGHWTDRKEGWGKKIQRFSSFMRQYLENGADTAKVTISD